MRRIENLLVLKFKNKRPLIIIFYAIKENKDMVGEVKELASKANMRKRSLRIIKTIITKINFQIKNPTQFYEVQNPKLKIWDYKKIIQL